MKRRLACLDPSERRPHAKPTHPSVQGAPIRRLTIVIILAIGFALSARASRGSDVAAVRSCETFSADVSDIDLCAPGE